MKPPGSVLGGGVLEITISKAQDKYFVVLKKPGPTHSLVVNQKDMVFGGWAEVETSTWYLHSTLNTLSTAKTKHHTWQVPALGNVMTLTSSGTSTHPPGHQQKDPQVWAHVHVYALIKLFLKKELTVMLLLEILKKQELAIKWSTYLTPNIKLKKWGDRILTPSHCGRFCTETQRPINSSNQSLKKKMLLWISSDYRKCFKAR